MNFKDYSLEELIKKIQAWDTTSKEVFDYFLGRIEKYENKIEAFNFINKKGYSEQNWLLFGLPIWVKDIYCEKWIPTTGSSKMLKTFIPPYDATVIKKLKDAGMNSIWKLNMDEFAMWSSTENSAFKSTVNPWGTNRIPGGSSGGSSAAVAAGLVPAALGTDTGWSLRQPASMCWVVGFRPWYGRNSRYGIMPMASSFDCPGTITKTVRDAALLYNIMNWEDHLENTTIPGKDEIHPKIWDTKDLKWKRIWIPKEYFEEGLDNGVRKVIEKAIDDMKNLWAEIVEVSLPMTKYAIAAYYIIVPAEVTTNLARLDGIRYGHNSIEPRESLDELYLNNRGEWLWDEATRRTILGSYVLSAWFYDAYYKKASEVRTLIIEDFNKAFEKVDVIVSPVSPNVAWEIGEKVSDPLKMYLEDAYTIPASLAGLPGMSVPAGFAMSEDDNPENLPVWLQILAPRMHEQGLLEIAHVYEQNTPWKDQMTPPGFED